MVKRDHVIASRPPWNLRASFVPLFTINNRHQVQKPSITRKTSWILFLKTSRHYLQHHHVMPGPSNKRKQKKAQARKDKRRTSARLSIGGPIEAFGEVILSEEILERGAEGVVVDTLSEVHARPLPEPPISTHHLDDPSSGTSLTFIATPQCPSPSLSSSPSPPPLHPIPFDSWDLSHNHTPAPPYILSSHPDTISEKPPSATSQEPPDDDIFLRLSNPIIHDPGNGPRVLSAQEFIHSSFAQSPCTSDPLRAEFAQPEVLQMLCTVLPQETAIVCTPPNFYHGNSKARLTLFLQFVWYNKSRKVGRVCPACRRLYQLGDALSNPFTDLDMDDPPEKKESSPHLAAEQEISGLCTSFLLSVSLHHLHFYKLR